MKNKKAKVIALLLGSLATNPISSFAFDTGSDGSYGPITMSNTASMPLTNTLVLPANGIFNCTSINVGTNCVLNFIPNSLNTPVYLLAQTNIVINGTIDISGQSGTTYGSFSTVPGPGGFGGGAGGTPTANIPAGYGQGPGGGVPISGSASTGGAFGTAAGVGNVATYGNLLLSPLIGGSGGGGFSLSGFSGASGGAGGGAILVASSTSINFTGVISARGGGAATVNNGDGLFSGAGSGGAIRMVAPAITLAGVFDVSGGTNSIAGNNRSYGGNGRVRIDTPSTVNASVIGNGYASSPIVSYGRSLFIFPTASPELYFLNAAGTAIPAGSTNAVAISLPSGSPTNQVITLVGTNFLGTVPVEIVATPLTGTPYTTNIVLNFPNPNSFVQTNVTINVPNGIPTQLNAYANYYVQP